MRNIVGRGGIQIEYKIKAGYNLLVPIVVWNQYKGKTIEFKFEN